MRSEIVRQTRLELCTVRTDNVYVQDCEDYGAATVALQAQRLVEVAGRSPIASTLTKDSAMEEPQIIYLLRNEATPGLVKIGRTAGDLAARMKQLYTTGVPVPFQCIYAVKVEHLTDVEKTLHFAFGGQRLHENREFFTVEPERVIAILKLLNGQEVTGLVESTIQAGLTAQDKAAEAELKKKRPVLDFAKLGIPPEAKLLFQDGVTSIQVVSNRKVEFDGQSCYLVTPTRKLLGLAEDYPIQPGLPPVSRTHPMT
jgi:hypothetical protein